MFSLGNHLPIHCWVQSPIIMSIIFELDLNVSNSFLEYL